MQSNSVSQNCGYVSSNVLYTSAEVRNRLGLGDWAWRQLRRQGLRVIKVGNRSFVLGGDVIDLFESFRDRGGLPKQPSLNCVSEIQHAEKALTAEGV